MAYQLQAASVPDRLHGGDADATLHFFSPPPDGAAPEFQVTDASGNGKRNYPHDSYTVYIRNMRDLEDAFSLDQHGFAAIQGPWGKQINFADDAEMGDFIRRYRRSS